jgi:SPP1 gp7 family putative phage head morphogenesis protein
MFLHNDQNFRVRPTVRRINRRRLPRQIWPRAEARAYFDELRAILGVLREVVTGALARELSSILAEAPRRDAARADAVSDRISRMINGVRITYAERVSESRLREAARKAGRRVSQRQREQVDRQVKVVTGIDPFLTDIAVGEHIETFVSENVSLIRSISTKHFEEVEQLVLRGARTGEGAETIAGRIQARFKVAESRANLIARDQVAKLFGEVNELRQRELGITEYTWRTSQDERVRPDHAALDGKIIKWSKPPIVDKKTGRRGHPGTDYQCRCVAEPIFADDRDT